MRPVVVITLVLLAVLLVGCEKQRPLQAPVRFDATGLVAGPEALNTNAIKITGALRIRDGALSDKSVLLRIAGSVSFKLAGVTKPFFARDDQVLITNGTGKLELWFFVSPAERNVIEAELAAPAYVFESPGYTELKPASLEVR